MFCLNRPENYLIKVDIQAHRFYNNKTRRVNLEHLHKCTNVIRKTNNIFPRGKAFQRLLFIDLTTFRPSSIPVSAEFNKYCNEVIDSEQ